MQKIHKCLQIWIQAIKNLQNKSNINIQILHAKFLIQQNKWKKIII